MAASDEFPRGIWVNGSSGGAGVPASITLPAIPKISWVITDIEAIEATYNPPSNETVQNPLTLSTGPPYGLITYFVSTGEGTQGSWTWSGRLLIPSGSSVTIKFQNPPGAPDYQAINLATYTV